MNIQSKKIIKDPLYDYIIIDRDICDQVIDNKHFQRLRRIEQTSMRCLYPSARHDRFIHSLGVYHLAKIAIAALQNNGIIVVNERYSSEKSRFIPTKDVIDNLNFSFEMAALLHDVGHSPFSHTLEDYFKFIYTKNVNGGIDQKKILQVFLERIKNLITDTQEENFDTFSANVKVAQAAPHEIISCIVILDCFKQILDNLAANRGLKIEYCFLTRCILGALYTENSPTNDYKNCIIKLLNSSIDVDKLDYISRDSQVSGFDNMMVDNMRLLNSLVLALFEDRDGSCKLCLAFKKMATGVIQNVVISRNSLYTWIYSHHKVKYESHLIHEAIRLISEHESNRLGIAKELYISELFSIDKIEKELLCDDTIWNLFMQHIDIPEVAEIIERNSQKAAVWKSFAEFQAYFDTGNDNLPLGEFSVDAMRNSIEGDITGFVNYLNNNPDRIQFDVVVNKTKLSHIGHNTIIIYINNNLYSFDSLFGGLYKSSSIPPFFYIYCKKSDKRILNQNNAAKKDELIKYIKQYDGFRKTPNH